MISCSQALELFKNCTRIIRIYHRLKMCNPAITKLFKESGSKDFLLYKNTVSESVVGKPARQLAGGVMYLDMKCPLVCQQCKYNLMYSINFIVEHTLNAGLLKQECSD